MNKLILLFGLVVMLTSCAKRDIYLMSDEEVDKSPYSMSEFCVMRGDSVVVAMHGS